MADVFVCLPDLPADPTKGDVLLRNGRTYSVADVDTNGRGGARLYLRSLNT